MILAHSYTVAGTGAAGFAGDGGPATSAEPRDPLGIGVDGSGNLLISDTGNGRVREVNGSPREMNR
jgi:NHL repeat